MSQWKQSKKKIKPLYNHVWFCGGLVFARLTGCILALPSFLLPLSLTYLCPAILCVQWKDWTFSTLWSGHKKANFPSAASSDDNKTLTGRSDLTKTTPLLTWGVALRSMGELSTRTASSAMRPEQNVDVEQKIKGAFKMVLEVQIIIFLSLLPVVWTCI